MEAIIFAGRMGTRLRSRVADRPKPMAPIAGRPFLAILLDHLARHGFARVVLSVGYGRDSIMNFFGRRHGALDISYPVGRPWRPADPVWVLNGDTFVQLDYRAMLEAYAADWPAMMTMAVRRVPDASRYGTVEIAGDRVAGFTPAGSARGGLINSGVCLLGPALFAGGAGRVFSFERDFLPAAIERLPIQAFVTEGWFIDIGVPEDYDRAQTELRRWVLSK